MTVPTKSESACAHRFNYQWELSVDPLDDDGDEYIRDGEWEIVGDAIHCAVVLRGVLLWTHARN